MWLYKWCVRMPNLRSPEYSFSEWRTSSLRELIVNHDGMRKPVKESDRSTGPYPYYGASGIVDYVDSYLFDGEFLLIAEDGENLRTRQTPVAFIARGKFWVNNHAHVVTANDKADTRFLMYALQIADIDKYLSGAVMPKLTQGNLNQIEIPCPPLETQHAIAHILGALDDKIELNRRMNATLEKMARALFQSWFMDFDPVRARMEGRQPVGLDAATAALFPDSFEDSPLGSIPRGWKITMLGEACEAGGGNIQTGPFGTQLHASDYVVEGIPSIMPSDLRDNRIETKTISRIREADAARLNVYRVQVGDVVYSRRGDVERRALIRHAENGWLCGTGCLRVRFGARGLNSHFAAAYLGTAEARAWVVRHAVGATMPNLNTSILGALPLIVPSVELQARFAEIVGAWDERGTIALHESRTLSTLRDALLPKLLSGELSVASLESSIAASV